MQKLSFDIDNMMERIRAAVDPYPKAAMFELAEDGYTTLFEQLVACIISIRTFDEVTLVASRSLFARARTPTDIAALSAAEIDRLIHPATFHERKALQILKIAQQTRDDFGSELPCEPEVLMSFSGVGIKCTNLALSIACGQARISVDVHVHRVTNRWGYVRAAAPEQTVQALEQTLPRHYWIEINRLLVPFGKHICTGRLPHCSSCPVLAYCRQVGVERSL